jgi:5-methyltetrahydropteroyltriglutamate--homocysteine methyltransferase
MSLAPGVISLFFRNDHYANQEAYLLAIAEAMRSEYEAIAAAGVILQIDCPDLAMGRHIQYADFGAALDGGTGHALGNRSAGGTS